MAANQLVRDGDRAGGRRQLEAIWSRIEGRDPYHECSLAHVMADVQDDMAEELAWDLRALEAAGRCTDVDMPPGQSVEGFMPSLHASLATDYLKLRDVVRSREHLAQARRFEHALADDGYGKLVRSAIASLASRLDGLGAQPST